MSLGFGFEYKTPEEAVVTVVEPGGPADAAGVRVGDVILQVNGEPVQNLPRGLKETLTMGGLEVSLLLQAQEQLLSAGTWGFIGMGSLRSRPQPRSVTIRRRPHKSPGKSREDVSLPPAAAAHREVGRECFRQGKWDEASRAFTEAISVCSDSHTLYTNRALCHQKLGRWELVERDARLALSQPKGGSNSVKAHYLLGKALLELGRHEEAKHELLKSMSLSSSPDFKNYRGSIDAALCLARKRIWEKEQVKRSGRDYDLREELLQLAERCHESKKRKGADAPQTSALEDRSNAIYLVFKNSAQRNEVSSIPKGIICRLSRKVMIDPVTSPFGQTYDREAIEEHLAKSGGCDPFNANERYTASQLINNLALKNFIDQFLEKHPWAFEHVC
uniref:RING-type E3 ubiquitin transferase n=1 Tax=Guillardia theta TaxID=55529 RepID=A0A7S4JKG3_GUITH|mmetsp:Transcript_17176/g.56913  ORF Transcript_17176/g.56913 Transcript_17176/m.56913 type:complete len:389 (+) Transcript_17176:79-1245(+)